MTPATQLEGRVTVSIDNHVGEAIREARKNKGLTLRDLVNRSEGRFKASATAGYERGERHISVDKFIELASILGVPPDRLMSDIMKRTSPETREELVIDLNRLSLIDHEDVEAIAEYIYSVKAQRKDYLSEIITLRSGDLEQLALAKGLDPSNLLQEIKPALQD
jgi:transcriptional regulator with XRE-family HTH domain